MEGWDVDFADLYLDALEAYRRARRAPGPGASPSGPKPALPPVAHVLLGMNAHINYDLPQSLVPSSRPRSSTSPAAEDRRRATTSASTPCSPPGRGGGRRARARRGPPDNRWTGCLRRSTGPARRLFLRESRPKVWANPGALNQARLRGPRGLRAGLSDLEA